MKALFFILFITLLNSAVGQKFFDTKTLPFIPYKAKVAVNNVIQYKSLSLDSLLKYGLQVTLDDKSYNVIQFAIIYDCPSKSVLDFSVRTYLGDKVNGSDEYFRNRILVGDVIEISHTVIENRGYRVVMKDASYIITQ